MSIKITSYNAICNLGSGIGEIYENALNGNAENFTYEKNIIKGKTIRLGKVLTDLPEIQDEKYNIRCNRLIKHVLNLMEDELNKLIEKYLPNEIAVVAATTNTGVDEFATTKNLFHAELSNPAEFTKEYLNLKNIAITVSTACSSGIKAFSEARNFLNAGLAKAVIVVGSDSLAKTSLFGFDSLELLTEKPSIPFSKNRCGINIGEGAAVFIVEKDVSNGIEIMGIGENTDTYHATTPDPEATEAKKAIMVALSDAKITVKDVDYINLHGTGTFANDLMEAKAVFETLGNTPSSSTKSLTGHCLGAAASIETALCCKLLDSFDGKLFPHIFDGVYDDGIAKINLAEKNTVYKKCNIVMCNAFGFGGANAILILGKTNG